MTIVKRTPEPTIRGTLDVSEPARPTDYGVGRRCVECGGKVSRYSEPAPDGPRCERHWTLPDDCQYVLTPTGKWRVVKEVSRFAAPAERETQRVDREVEAATEAGLRLDAAVTCAAACRILHVALKTLQVRVEARGLEPVGSGYRRKPLYPLGALIGLDGFGAASPLPLPVPEPESEPELVPLPALEGRGPGRTRSAARRRAARVEAAGLAFDDLVTLGEAAAIFQRAATTASSNVSSAELGAEPRGRA